MDVAVEKERSEVRRIRDEESVVIGVNRRVAYRGSTEIIRKMPQNRTCSYTIASVESVARLLGGYLRVKNARLEASCAYK